MTGSIFELYEKPLCDVIYVLESNPIHQTRFYFRVYFYAVLWVLLLRGLVNALGVVIYAYYAGCDPLTKLEPEPKSALSIIMFFLSEYDVAYPGLMGLFIAAMSATTLRYNLQINMYKY